MTDLASAQEAAYQKELHKNCIPKSMTEISKLDELVRDLTSVAYPMAKSEVRARIESLLAEVKRDQARQIIDEMFEHFPTEPDGTISAKAVVNFKDQLRSKYLTPTGNLDK